MPEILNNAIPIALYSLSGALMIIGYVGCVLPYPGHLFILAACATLPSQGASFPGWLWGVLILLSIGGMLADNVTTYLGCKKRGASRGASWGSLLGLFIGAFFMPIGLILGPFIGAFTAEYIIAKRDLKGSAKVGIGATLGLIAGMLVKLIIASIMLTLCASWIYLNATPN